MSSAPKTPEGSVPCLKGRFPFSFGCTSYLVPADIEPNILAMRSQVDEMELILFEGADASNIPSKAEVERFGALAGEAGLRFNVHLPLDGDIVSGDAAERARSLEAARRIVELTEPLDPTTRTLHVLPPADGRTVPWRDRVRESLRQLPGDPRGYSVETLAYDLRVIGDIIRELDFSVCIDVGHLLVNGFEVGDFFRDFAGRVAMVHLHGVSERRDHLSLAALPQGTARAVGEIITGQGYSGSLCLELFSLEEFAGSIPALLGMFGGRTC